MKEFPPSLAAVLGLKRRDISVALCMDPDQGSIDFPGDPTFALTRINSTSQGDPFTLSQISLSVHCGTHIETPAHFLAHGPSIDQFPLDSLLLPTQVLDLTGLERIGAPALAAPLRHVEPGQAVLLKTDNSMRGICRNGRFQEDYVPLTQDGAQALAQLPVALVGHDYATLEPSNDRTFSAHHALLGNNIPILEGIDLAEVPPGPCILLCLPLRIKGCEASPVRAVLLSEQ
ncbi:MAG: cyclase family protein [Desulfovibrio sp.]|nr:MAG: cyclase family protein [Desulfovibrio sp.]